MTTLSSRIYQHGKLVAVDLDREALAEAIASHERLVWIDFIDPKREDLAWVAKALHLHPIAITDALEHHTRPKLDRYEHHLFLVGYVFSQDGAVQTGVEQVETGQGTIGQTSTSMVSDSATTPPALDAHEIALFVTPNVIVSVRRDQSDIVSPIELLLDKHDTVAKSGGLAVLWAILDVMVDSQFSAVQALDDVLDELEDRVFDQCGAYLSELQRDIFTVRKNLVTLRRLTLPMREIINSILRGDTVPVSKVMQPYFTDVYDHTLRVDEWVDSQRDLVTSLLDANLTIQGNRMNLIMKKVTSWAAIIAVPTAITGFFGQNVAFFGFGKPSGLILSCALMVATTGVLYWQFKRRDWL